MGRLVSARRLGSIATRPAVSRVLDPPWRCGEASAGTGTEGVAGGHQTRVVRGGVVAETSTKARLNAPAPSRHACDEPLSLDGVKGAPNTTPRHRHASTTQPLPYAVDIHQNLPVDPRGDLAGAQRHPTHHTIATHVHSIALQSPSARPPRPLLHPGQTQSPRRNYPGLGSSLPLCRVLHFVVSTRRLCRADPALRKLRHHPETDDVSLLH